MAVHLWKAVARVWVDLVEAEVMFEGILHPQCELTHHLHHKYISCYQKLKMEI